MPDFQRTDIFDPLCIFRFVCAAAFCGNATACVGSRTCRDHMGIY